MIRILTRHKKTIGTFDDFVKILGDGPSPKQREINSYMLPDHWNQTNFWEFLLRGTEKYASLRSILHRKSSCSRTNFKQCRPSILKCLQGMDLLRFLKFITVRFPPSFFSTTKRLLRNCPCLGTTFWIAHFSNIPKSSCSTNENCSFEIFVKFDIFSWNGRFTSGIMYSFTIDKIYWSCIIFPKLLLSKLPSLPANGTFGMLFVK